MSMAVETKIVKVFIMYQFKSITDIRSHKTFSTLNQADSTNIHFKSLCSTPSFNRPQGLSTQAHQLGIFNTFVNTFCFYIDCK